MAAVSQWKPTTASGAQVKTDAATTEAAAPSAVSMDSGTPDYSGTNVQVKGVDEADIVKTDGSYIYYVAGNQLNILKANGADTQLDLEHLALGGRQLVGL